MDTYIVMGWVSAAGAVIYALGLIPRFSVHFYKRGDGFARRLTTPVLLAGFSLACLMGRGREAFAVALALSIARQIIRWGNGRKVLHDK